MCVDAHHVCQMPFHACGAGRRGLTIGPNDDPRNEIPRADVSNDRKAKLAEALRANLKRRKAQVRARATQATEGDRPDGTGDALPSAPKNRT
jgi:hypothetical protein